MAVAASPGSPQVFKLDADTRDDIYVMTIQFIITAANMNFGDFGSGAALTDPCILRYKRKDGFVVLEDQLVANSDYVLLAQGQPAFGTEQTAFQGQSPIMGMNTDDAYIPSVDLRKVYGLPWGVRLAAGSRIGLEHVVQDNTTNANEFLAKVIGFRRSPDGTEG